MRHTPTQIPQNRAEPRTIWCPSWEVFIGSAWLACFSLLFAGLELCNRSGPSVGWAPFWACVAAIPSAIVLYRTGIAVYLDFKKSRIPFD